MLNFTNNRRGRNNKSKSIPRTPPPPEPVKSNQNSITRSVLEGVGLGAGSAIGRSIVERGFDSITRMSKSPDETIIRDVEDQDGESIKILRKMAEGRLEEYYKCIHNIDGTSEYDNCKILYDKYLECTVKTYNN